MDERLLLKVKEQDKQAQKKMIIYECENGHLRQSLEDIEVTCNRCGKLMMPRSEK